MRGRLYSPVDELQVDRHFGAEAVIGRNPQSTVEVPLSLVSAQHARISWDPQHEYYVLEDLGSSNGTRLDGEPVTEPRPLGHLHVITLSEHYDLVFQDLDRCVVRHGSDQAGREPTLHTSIEVLDLPLPGALQRGKRSEGKRPEKEKTLFGRFDIPLPDLLRSSSADARSEDTSTDQVPEPDREGNDS
ncbi:MAG: FHA domain-containing protein [Thermoanaerobaculia bacterium]|nr:FHA domain-containing protein [Thermoanaerobaculia bacterium]